MARMPHRSGECLPNPIFIIYIVFKFRSCLWEYIFCLSQEFLLLSVIYCNLGNARLIFILHVVSLAELAVHCNTHLVTHEVSRSQDLAASLLPKIVQRGWRLLGSHEISVLAPAPRETLPSLQGDDSLDTSCLILMRRSLICPLSAQSQLTAEPRAVSIKSMKVWKSSKILLLKS